MTATAGLESRSARGSVGGSNGEAVLNGEAVPMYDLIELLFFAYRDFAADADQLLAAYGFGRAHHRILYFVDRRPGQTIAELLDILRVTKQSLSRVLKELLEAGLVEARAGTADRRQRRLFATPAGQSVALQLAQLQSRRLGCALAGLPPGARPHASAFLAAMIEPRDGSQSAACVVAAMRALRPEAMR